MPRISRSSAFILGDRLRTRMLEEGCRGLASRILPVSLPGRYTSRSGGSNEPSGIAYVTFQSFLSSLATGEWRYPFLSLARSPSPPIAPSFSVRSHTGLRLLRSGGHFSFTTQCFPQTQIILSMASAIPASPLPLPNHVPLQRRRRTSSASVPPVLLTLRLCSC